MFTISATVWNPHQQMLSSSIWEGPEERCRVRQDPSPTQVPLDLSLAWTSDRLAIAMMMHKITHGLVDLSWLTGRKTPKLFQYLLTCWPPTQMRHPQWNSTPGHQEDNRENWWSLTVGHELSAGAPSSLCHPHLGGFCSFHLLPFDSPDAFNAVLRTGCTPPTRQ